MLFILENCIPQSYENDYPRMLALTNLLRSHGARNNIVYAKKNILQSFIDTNFYGSLEKGIAVDIIDMGHEIAALKNELAVYTIVDFDSTANDVRYDPGRNAIVAGFRIFTEVSNCDAINLIVENGSDYKFYKKIGEYFSRLVFNKNLTLSLRFRLGAGSHSKSEFDRLEGENEFCLCIVDSDKKHPAKGLGSTSAAFTELNKQYYKTGIVVVLPEHREAECLIPMKYIDEVVQESINDKIDVYDEIYDYYQSNSKFRNFFDFKEGITLRQAIDLDNKHGDFWLNILGSNRKFSSKKCFIDRVCEDCGSCPKVDGISPTLLDQVVNFLDKKNIHDFKRDLDDDLVDQWRHLGFIIMSWSCSLPGVVRSS